MIRSTIYPPWRKLGIVGTLERRLRSPKSLLTASQTTKDKYEAAMVKYNAYKRKKQILLWWVDCFLAMMLALIPGDPLLGPISFQLTRERVLMGRTDRKSVV